MFAQFYGISFGRGEPSESCELLETFKMARIPRKEHQIVGIVDGAASEDESRAGIPTDPRVLFLDGTRRLAWTSGRRATVRAFVHWRWIDTRIRLATLLLTTHYMVEADEQCGHVAIINGGRVLASPTLLLN